MAHVQHDDVRRRVHCTAWTQAGWPTATNPADRGTTVPRPRRPRDRGRVTASRDRTHGHTKRRRHRRRHRHRHSHATVTVNGRALPLAGTPAHHGARLAARPGPDRRQGGLRRGRVRRLLRPGRPARRRRRRPAPEWTAINACLVPAAALDGQEVVTAEGLGTPDALHPVQREMAVRGGSQCGYCTPGLRLQHGGGVLPARPQADRTDAADGDDARARAERLRPARPQRQPVPVHRLPADPGRGVRPRPSRPPTTRSPHAGPAPAPAAATDPARRPTARRSSGPATWPRRWSCWPSTPTRSLVAGSTDWGVEVNLRGSRAPLAVAVDRLARAARLRRSTSDEIEIGAALTLTEIERRPRRRRPAAGRAVPAVRLAADPQRRHARRQPRHRLADRRHSAGAARAGRRRRAGLGRRRAARCRWPTTSPATAQTVRRPDELIREVRIPLPLAALTAFHKIAKRRFDDISSVAVGLRARRRRRRRTPARIGLGGVAATPIRALGDRGGAGRPAVDRGDRPRRPRRCSAPRARPIDDHRASAGYRAAMLGQSLLQAVRRDRRARQEVGA